MSSQYGNNVLPYAAAGRHVFEKFAVLPENCNVPFDSTNACVNDCPYT
jgi:hypothetical protein